MESIIQILISGNTSSGVTYGQVELYDNEPLTLKYQISDVRNATQRGDVFSQSFTVPGNPNNNRLFSNIFEIGIDSYFDPRKKAAATIIVDYSKIAKGYIQLLDISVSDKDTVQYQFVFYGETNNLATSIEGKYLTDLDFSELNHTLSSNQVMKTWSGSSNPTLTASTYGYYYGFADMGYNWDLYTLNGTVNSGYGLGVEQLIPQTYTKYILDKMFSAIGYSYESTFLSSLTFNQLVTTTNVNPSEIQPSSYRTDRLFSSDNYSAPVTLTDFTFSFGAAIGPGLYMVEDSLGLNLSFNPTITPTLGSYIVGGLGNQDNYSADTFTLQRFYLPLSFSANNGTNVPNLQYTNIKTKIYRSTYSTLPSAGPGGLAFHTETTPNYYNGNFTYTVDTGYLNNPISTTHYPVQPGEQFEIWFEFVAKYSSGPSLSTSRAPISNFSCKWYNDVLQGVPAGGNVVYNNYIPRKFLQTDFLNSLINKFNLYIEPSKSDVNRLIIEPRDIFYSGGTVITDWVVDQTKPITEKLLSEQQNRKIIFSDKEDKDYLNDNYKQSLNRVFGDYYFDVENEFVTGEKKIETMFSPSPLKNVNFSSSIIVPSIFKLDSSGNYGQATFNPRLLRKNPAPIKTSGGEYFKFSDTGNLSAYPFVGHINHPFTGTTDYNFGTVEWEYFNLNAITNNNAVNAYWSQYLNQIRDKDAKLITCNIWLKALDIQKFSFRNIVFLEGLTNDGGAYFIVQSIEYNPTVNESSKVELLKLPSITFTPTTGVSVLNNTPMEADSVARQAISLAGGNSTYPGSITIGEASMTNARNSINIGTNSIVSADQSISIGSDSRIGSNSYNSFSVGSGNTIGSDARNVLLFGNSNTASTLTSGNILFGSNNLIQTGVTDVILMGVSNFTATTANTISNTLYTTNVNIFSSVTLPGGVVFSGGATSFCSTGLETSTLSGCGGGDIIFDSSLRLNNAIKLKGATVGSFGQIDLEYFGTPGKVFISTDGGAGGQSYLDMTSGYFFGQGFNSVILGTTSGVTLDTNNIGVSNIIVGAAKNAATLVCEDSTINIGAYRSSIIGGSGNTINNNIENSVILGGQNIVASVNNTVYVPNLVIQGNQTFKSANSTASGNASFSFGSGNTASGNLSFSIGNNNTSLGVASYSEGNGGIASGYCAHVEGSTSDAIGDYSHAGGFNSYALNFGEWCRSSNQLGAYGIVSYGRQTTNATTTEIFLNNANTKRFVVETDAAYFVELSVVARNNTTSDSIQYKGQGLIKNVAGTVSLVGTFTMTSTNGDVSLATTSVTVTADNTNKSLKVEVTGVALTTINWFAKAEYTRTY